MLKRRKFSEEFKHGAVERTNQSGVSCGQVTRELGIREEPADPLEAGSAEHWQGGLWRQRDVV